MIAFRLAKSRNNTFRQEISFCCDNPKILFCACVIVKYLDNRLKNRLVEIRLNVHIIETIDTTVYIYILFC